MLIGPVEYAEIKEPYILVKKNEIYSWLDMDGKEVLSLKDDFFHVARFYDGLAYVYTKDYKRGFINTQGEFVIPCKYEDARDFSQGLAWVQLNNKWGCIDKEGKVVVPFK
jgi:hypothetical protein